MVEGGREGVLPAFLVFPVSFSVSYLPTLHSVLFWWSVSLFDFVLFYLLCVSSPWSFSPVSHLLCLICPWFISIVSFSPLPCWSVCFSLTSAVSSFPRCLWFSLLAFLVVSLVLVYIFGHSCSDSVSLCCFKNKRTCWITPASWVRAMLQSDPRPHRIKMLWWPLESRYQISHKYVWAGAVL